MPILTQDEFNALPDGHTVAAVHPSNVFTPEEFNALPDAQPANIWQTVKHGAQEAVGAVQDMLNPAQAVRGLASPRGEDIINELPAVGAGVGSLAGPGGTAIGAASAQVLKEGAQAFTGSNAVPQSALSAGAQPIEQGAIQLGAEAAMPYALKALDWTTKAVGGVSDWFATKAGQYFLNAYKRDYSYGHNPAQALVDEKIVAPTWDSLIEKVGDARAALGKEYDKIFAARPDATVDLSEISQPIEKAIDEAGKMPERNATLINNLNGLWSDVEQYAGVKSLPEAQDIKSMLYSASKFTGNPSDDAILNRTQQAVAGKIAAGMKEVAPELGPLNIRYGNLSSLATAAARRADIVNANPIPYYAAGGGALIGGLAGGSVGAATGATISAGMKVPAVATPAIAALGLPSEAAEALQTLIKYLAPAEFRAVSQAATATAATHFQQK